MNYVDFHTRSIQKRDAFWAEQAALIDWHKPFEQVLDYSMPPFAKWFVGGRDQPLPQRHRPPSRGTRRPARADLYLDRNRPGEAFTPMASCIAEVQRMAAVLQSLGVAKGDRVLIYMPMIPEAIFAMLATVRLGAIHSVVFGGFAAPLAGHPHRRRPAQGSGQPPTPACAAANPSTTSRWWTRHCASPRRPPNKCVSSTAESTRISR